MKAGTTFVQQHAQGIATLLAGAEMLGNLRTEYTALDLGNVLTEEDCAALGITKAQFVDVVAAVDAVRAAIDSNKTNLYRGLP